MNARTILDQIIFQLTPTRTRCELFAVAGDATEKLTAGLVKPFLSHLSTAEEQLAKGGYTIKLRPRDRSKASWFTKGTAERFVRFVSSPEVIERVNTIETELLQLEETIRMQTLMPTRVEDSLTVDSSPISIMGEKTFSSSEKPRLPKKMRQASIDSNDSGVGGNGNSKKQLLRALEARRLVLQKEQGMAFARAAAAGYELVPLLQLIIFSDCFGAARLRDACINFVALCRKRQIPGFCMGDTEWIEQDLTWALSNTTCASILSSMKEVLPIEKKIEGDSDDLRRSVKLDLDDEWKLHTGIEELEVSSVERGYHTKLPLVHANLSSSSPVCEWSHFTDLCQGWPAMYTTRNNPYATFHGYQYGFSPGSQESFTAVPGMPSVDATGLYQHPMGILTQPLSETQENLQMSSSQERTSLTSLRKLQPGQTDMQNRMRMSGRDIKSKGSFIHGYEKDSSELTDSSFERSDSLRVGSVVLQDEFASNVVVRDYSRQGPVADAESNFELCSNKRSTAELADLRLERSRRGSDSSDLSDCITETEVPNLKALSSGDSLVSFRRNKETARLDRSFGLHQCLDVQGCNRTLISDNSSVHFKQCRDGGSLGNKWKKRLDFQDAKSERKQQPSQQESKQADDSFYICSHSVNHESRTNPMIEYEVQCNQIFDRMSKQALKVNSKQATKTNSVTLKQQDPDDLLMLSKQRKRAPTRNLSDVMNIDVELLKSEENSNLVNSQKVSMNSEPSQERVKKFLDQYNEKRQAKIRGDMSSGKMIEREGKLKAMQEELESRKLEIARARRPERTALQTEAQVRANKLRLYKADLQKIKKEKEDEERRRLQELKAQRQERIAARSNLARSNSNSSTPQVRMSSKLPTSNSKPRQVGGLLPPQKSSISLPSSQTFLSARQRAVHSQELNPEETLPRSSSCLSKTTVNQARSTVAPVLRQRTVHSQELNPKETPPRSSSRLSKTTVNQVRSTVSPVSRQIGKASIGSQRVVKTPSFKAPHSIKSSAAASSSSIFSAVCGAKQNQSRPSSLKRIEPALITSKDPGSFPRLPGHRGQTSRVGKDMPKTLDEMKQEVKTFLKRGSGALSSFRSVQRPKPVSRCKPRAMDKRPHFLSGTTNRNGLKMLRRDINEAKVSNGVPTSQTIVLKTNSSTPTARSNGLTKVYSPAKAETKVMASSNSKQKEVDDAQRFVDVVHLEAKSSAPRYLHDKEMVRASDKSPQHMSSSLLEKSYTPSEAAIDLHQRLPADRTMSRVMTFDRSCAMNGDSSSNKQCMVFNTIFPIKNSYPESTVSSGNTVGWHFKDLTPCEEQSDGLQKIVRFDQRSNHSPTAGKEALSRAGDEMGNRRSAFLEQQPKHPSQSAVKPLDATLAAQGKDSGTFTGSAAKVLQISSFLG